MPTKYEGDNVVTVGLDTYHDFICDGAADNVQIAAAIDYVGQRGGGVVAIDAGTYDIAASIQKEYNNMTVRGCGKGVTKFVASVANVKLLGLEQIDTQNASISNIRIIGITFDMNDLAQGLHLRNVTNFTVEDCAFTNSLNTFPLMCGMTNVTNFAGFYGRKGTIRDCDFSENHSATIENINLGQGIDFLLDNCHFDTCSNIGGAVYSWFALNVRFKDCTFRGGSHVGVEGDGPFFIDNCSFYDSYLNGNGVRSVKVVGSHFETISDASPLSGIYFSGMYRIPAESGWYDNDGPSYIDKIIIDSCEFKNCHENGIKIAPYFAHEGTYYVSAKSVKIQNCVFDNIYWNGINAFAKSMTVVGNEFRNCNRANGVVKAGFYGGAEKLVFDNNTAYEDNGSGKQTYGACFRNEAEEVGISSGMKILAPSNFMEGGVKYFYTGAVQASPAETMVLTTDNLITT